MPTVSDRVGCGWIVTPMSAASAPISIKGSFRDQIPSVSDQFVFEHRIADTKRSALLGRRLALMRIDRKQIAVTTR